jgi:HK97 family phage major capsid protein
VDKIKALLDELAAVVAEMEAMTETPEGESAEPMSEEQEASLRSLEARADKLKTRIEYLQRIEAKTLEMRSVVERGAPAKAIEKAAAKNEENDVEKRKVFAVPVSHGPLKAFRSAEDAYRAGMQMRANIFGSILAERGRSDLRDEARRWIADYDTESRAQAGTINELGGVLTSPTVATEVLRLVEEYGAFPRLARAVPMTSDSMNWPRRVGGLAARPVGENKEITQSDVTFDNVELVARIWGVLNRIPNSLLEDSPISLADAMAVETAQAVAEASDDAGYIGDGTATYHGVEGICTKIVKPEYAVSKVTATSRTSFGALTMQDFIDCVAKLPRFAARNAQWHVSPSGWGAAMLRLQMLPGGAAAPGGNTSSEVASGGSEQFLGYRVNMVHSMHADLGVSTGKVAALFGDLSQAAFYGTRRVLAIKTLTERYAEFDQTGTIATTRFAVSVHTLKTTKGGVDKAGPVIALVLG